MDAGASTASGELGFAHVLVPGSSRWTLLLLHGTGGDEHQLIDLGGRLAARASLLSPRGKVLEGGVSPRFFRRFSLTELDVADLIERTDELAGFVRAAATAYELDPARIVAVGYSNGANIASSLLFRRPDVLRGAVLLRPTLPYEPDRPLSLSGVNVLVAAGRRDPYVPLEKAARLAEALRSGGAEVSYRARDAGHELGGDDVADATGWLAALTGDDG
jgi:predicted esterase